MPENAGSERDKVAEILVELSDRFVASNGEADDCVRKVFHENQGNTNSKKVTAKVSILNKKYGVRVKAEDVVPRILKDGRDHELDRKLDDGSTDAFELIRRCNGKNGSGLWVFASKYCHFSNPNRFAIYDSRADTSAEWLFARGLISRPPSELEDNYEGYEKWIQMVRDCGNLTNGRLKTFKEIDQALYELADYHLKIELSPKEFRWSSHAEVYDDVFACCLRYRSRHG